MHRTFIVCENCGHVRIGRINDSGGLALSTESNECGYCGETSFRIYEESTDDE